MIKEFQIPEEKKEAEVLSIESIINLREKMYDDDVSADKNKKFMRSILDTHNNIVLEYAKELINKNTDLIQEEKITTIIAVILHDCGKLNSDLLEHHIKSAEYADKIMEKIIGKEIEGVKITREIKEKIKEAILRHMNHPFLIMLNNGKKFPSPEDNVDKIVFDADMLANIGFKNVGFRFNQKFMKEDFDTAKEQKIFQLQANFENVMNGVRGLSNIVLTQEAKDKAYELINIAEKIFQSLKNQSIFKKIQSEFSNNGEISLDLIEKNGGIEKIKNRLNEEIEIAGKTLGIDEKIIKNLKI